MIVTDLLSLAVDIDELRTMPGNPRRGDVDAVAQSLAIFGQRKPIVALTDGTVIAGNHTLAAAKQLGWSEIAVVRVADSDTAAKAYALADNRTAELGGYDDVALAAMLSDVAGVDAELFAATGWKDSELAKLLEEDGPTGPGGDNSEQLKSVYALVVTCRDESHQIELLQDFVGRGLECRALFG